MGPWLTNQLAALLPGLAPDRLHALAASSRVLALRRGAELLRAGDRWSHLWLVEQGALRLYYLDRQAHESNKNFFLEGQLLWPITPVLRTQPATFFVAALEPCRVHAFDVDALQALVGAEPAWQALTVRALQGLLDEKLWRERMFLQDSAAQRYAQLRAARPHWCERIALRHQASWLGMTDVSLSRLRAGLNRC